MNPSDKSALKNAQAKHLADLFGSGVAPAPTRQQADDQQRDRAAKLEAAARRKKAELDAAEVATLAALEERQRHARQAAATAPRPDTRPLGPPVTSGGQSSTGAPLPDAVPPRHGLAELSGRNDLAAVALANMQTHAREQSRREVSQPNPPAPAPAPESATSPSSQASPRPPASAADQAPPSPANGRPAPVAAPTQPPATSPAPSRPRRAAPSPEELEQMLKELSRRPSPRPSAPERPEAGGFDAAPEAPPETPPEDQPETNAEKQAEIMEQLRARESVARQQIKPLPAPEQERAAEKPVEASVPAHPVQGNALASGPYYEALAEIREAVRLHDPAGQVTGINKAQSHMADHPLSENA